VFSEQERLALAGFLAGYTGLTREAYALDLRQFAGWCQLHNVRLFRGAGAHRAPELIASPIVSLAPERRPRRSGTITRLSEVPR